MCSDPKQTDQPMDKRSRNPSKTRRLFGVVAVVDDFKPGFMFLVDVAVDFFFGLENFAAFRAHVLSRAGLRGAFAAFNGALAWSVHTLTSDNIDKGKEA